MKNIQQKVEEILATEPFVRMRDIEITAIVTGRASEYFGETTVEVLTKALQEQRAEIVKEIIKLEKNQGGIQSNIIVTSKEDDIYNNALHAVLTLLSTPNQEL